MNKKNTLPARAFRATTTLFLILFIANTTFATANFSLNTILVNGSDNDFSSIAFDAWNSGQNFNASITENLTSYWNFEESGTNITDVTGAAGTSGLLINGTNRTQGIFGNALRFDGIDDAVINIGTTSTLAFIHNTYIFTASAWIKYNNYLESTAEEMIAARTQKS